MLNVDGISIYIRTQLTIDSDQMRQIYLGEEELKVRRIGNDAMMEQDAVHIGYEADKTAHLLDTNGKKIGVTGLLDTGAVVSVMPIKTWKRMGFTREELIASNLRLAAANRGAIYVAGRTSITVLHMGGRDLWMSFLVVEKLDDADQFIVGRDFVRNFDVMIDLNNGLIRIRNPDQKYVKKPVNRIITDENKVPIFLDRKVKLQLGQAVAFFSMRNLNSLSDSKQVCLVPKLEMRTKFQDFEAAVNDRMKKIFNQLKERGKNYSSNKFEYEDDCIEDLEEADMSTQFLRIQKN